MAVQNIECQIALGQMSRYLSGDALAGDVEKELKEHISRCSFCAEALEHRRAMLKTMLGLQEPESADSTEPEIKKPKRARQRADTEDGAGNRFAAAVVEKRTVEPAPKFSSYWKPLMYSGALALVLVAMSLLMRDPTRIFGDRVATDPAVSGTATETSQPATMPAGGALASAPASDPISNPDATTSLSEAGSVPEPAEAPPIEDLKYVAISGIGAADFQAEPQGSKTTTPIPATKTTTRTASRRTQSRPKPTRTAPRNTRQGGGSIRVYDTNGNPLHP